MNPVRLGERDEVERRDHAEDRMPPSHQRFESQDVFGTSETIGW